MRPSPPEGKGGGGKGGGGKFGGRLQKGGAGWAVRVPPYLGSSSPLAPGGLRGGERWGWGEGKARCVTGGTRACVFVCVICGYRGAWVRIDVCGYVYTPVGTRGCLVCAGHPAPWLPPPAARGTRGAGSVPPPPFPLFPFYFVFFL